MDALKPKGLTYPKGLDEEKIGEQIQSILDGIDRERLFEDRRLTRVRHPLLAERMGKDIALNTEIYNLLVDLALHLSISNTMGDRGNTDLIEDILLKAAQDPKALQTNLAAFKRALTQLSAFNPDEAGHGISLLVGEQLRQKIKMPNLVQELMLYPAVTIASLAESNAQVFGMLEGCKKHLLDALDGKIDDHHKVLKENVEAEAAAIKAWFENTTA